MTVPAEVPSLTLQHIERQLIKNLKVAEFRWKRA